MTRYIELADRGDVSETDVSEIIFRKAMKRVEKSARSLAQSRAPVKPDGSFDLDKGRELTRQELIVQLIEWLGVELDGEVHIILYED